MRRGTIKSQLKYGFAYTLIAYLSLTYYSVSTQQFRSFVTTSHYTQVREY